MQAFLLLSDICHIWRTLWRTVCSTVLKGIMGYGCLLFIDSVKLKVFQRDGRKTRIFILSPSC